MMHGWQREPTDGPKRWLELCFLEWLQRLQWSPHPQLLDVAATVAVVTSPTTAGCSVVQRSCSCSCS